MTSLLGLYQQDAAAGDPQLMRPAPNIAAWDVAAKAYLTLLRDRYTQAEDVPPRQKQIAAHCLDLAIQALQTGASLLNEAATQRGERFRPGSILGDRPYRIILLVTFVLLLVNLWLLSISGVFSLFTVIATVVVLHERDRVVPERGRAEDARTASAPRAIPVNVPVEAVVRRIDAIIGLETRQTEVAPEAPLKVETLEFFQDILEAVIANDQDYAFKKISRTLEQVLLAEGIEVVTDARAQSGMFAIDTVADAARAGRVETVRPALAQASHCVKPGYAQQFVDA